MDLEFTPKSCDANGYFAAVHSSIGELLFYISSHAYQQPDGSWAPKLYPGTFTCQRGTHQLESGPPFVTFEVLGVEGHTGILFHVGNFPQKDSAGCNLTGIQIGQIGGIPAVLESGVAFEKFMALQAGVDQFTLTVLPA